MSTTRVPAALRRRVARQGRHRCGYCGTSEEASGIALQIDHLFPEAQGGLTEEENLWLACADCNAFKGDRTTALDPLTGEIAPLFNPRQHHWHEHFAWATGETTLSATPLLAERQLPRSTVTALKLNRPLLVRARRLWARIGVHPPDDGNTVRGRV